jgi:Holliday junction resolvase RusA-like endonuclease
MTRSRGTEVCSFFAPGIPRPKGNLSAVPIGKPHMVAGGRRAWEFRHLAVKEDPKRDKLLRPWMRAVQAAALQHRPSTPLTGPVEVRVVFYFEKPKKPTCAGWPLGREGDVDKYQRAIGDALEQVGMFKNDKQICRWVAEKRFGEPGAQITVLALEAEPEQLELAARRDEQPY